MIRRIGRRNYNIYAFDVESHNDIESIAKKETSIWLGSFIDEKSKVDDEESYIYSIEEWLDKLELLATNKKRRHGENAPCKNLCIYVWNLSFEWSFILPVMLKRGFKYKEVINHEDKYDKNKVLLHEEDEYVFNSVTTRSVSSVWLVNIKMGKGSGRIILRDLNKLFSGSLRNVAKSFNLPTQKGEIDYRLNRLHNHIVTDKEKEYCFKDTKIVMDILEIMNKRDDKDFWNSASASSYAMRKLIHTGWKTALRPYKEYRKQYPNLGSEETKFLRQGVEGGLTYAPKLWQFKEIDKPILHIDAHQMHPTQGYKHLFPYGEGTYFEGEPPKNPFKINCCRILISYVGVKLHSIIKLIGSEIVSNMEIVVWDFEIETMKKVYEDLEIKYVDGYSYNTRLLKWRDFYANNYKDRLIAKKKKDQFGTMYYKLLNNSSYGKLLEKPHNEIYENTIDEFGIITSLVIEKDQSKIETNAKYTYLPVGSCIPAYSRVCLIETALKFGWEKICYMDTDSLFIIYDEDTKRVWNKECDHRDFLGGWAIEEILTRAQFTAPKRYKTERVAYEGKDFIVLESDFKLAGINNIDSNNFNEVDIISSKWKVQRAFRCKGGTLIDFQEKEISVQQKYQDIYNKNIL